MPQGRLVAVGVCMVLVAGPWSAAAQPGGPVDPPAPALQAAEIALAQVERALDRDVETPSGPLPRRDLTLKLRDLRLALGDLAPADQAQARELLARPTDDWDRDGYARPSDALRSCTADLCVHWVPDTGDAPPATNSDSDTVPDYVESARNELAHIWARIVTQGGYRAPAGDGGRGGDSLLDVYLADIGDDGLYGYCSPEGSAPQTSGYCVLDNDYHPDQYGSAQAPGDNRRVTAAHEFFHAVQFAYDSWEDPWLMEGTAAWVEDEVYDHVDDNLQFIPGGPMTNPRVALDAKGAGSAGWYTSWTWWRYLAERFPDAGTSGMPLVIRRVWERADANLKDPQGHSLSATVRAIAAAGGAFTDVLAAYGDAKRHPATAFDEGATYRTVPVLATYRLKGGTRTTWKTAKLPHLTSQTFSFVPGKRTASRAWRLRIPVNAPDRSRGSHVQVSVLRKGGQRAVRPVPLDATGRGVAVTPFSSTAVRRVELTVTNAGRRYQCWAGTSLACQGRPLDNGLRTKFRGIARRG